MKRTALYHAHLALGAKMVPFAGFEMPVSYVGINAEHQAVRDAAGIFDVSHMGEFLISGVGSLDLLQRITTNDVSKLSPGKIQYSCMTNPQGGIVDDLLVYQLTEEEYLLVVNASNIEKDWQWIESQNHGKVEMKDVSEQTCLLALQGPKATEILQKFTSVALEEMAYYTFERGRLMDFDDVLISATGYTGAGGFELYLSEAAAVAVWNQLLEAGKALGLQPAGLGCRDTLRLEKGYCLYGNDIDDTTLPLEAGLGWITKFSKDFVGRGILESAKRNGVQKKLIGFEMRDKGIPRQGYTLCAEGGVPVGRVTSGTQSPSLQKAIGMGYVPTELAVKGTLIYVDVRGRLLEAEVVNLPFL